MKTALKQLGKSYKDTAQALGVSPACVSQIVNHGLWPKQNAAALRAAFIQFFQSSGAAVPDTLSQAPNTAPIPTTVSEDNAMLLKKAALTQAAKAAFGLSRNPFADEICASADVFLTPDSQTAREAMFQTALFGGFIAIAGESGSGKSTLREELEDRIIRDARPVKIIQPYVLAMEDNDIKGKTLKAAHIAEAILSSISPGVNPKRSPEARFAQVHEALKESTRAGNRHVLIIEEAHSLPLPTLKHLKRFFELKQGFDPLLGIILIGQTELAHKLSESNPSVREVVQRCEVINLLPLSDAQLEQYLKFKLDRAGKKHTDIITESGIAAIAERLQHRARTAQGSRIVSLLYPLAVNNLISACLNQAAELGFDRVDDDIVKAV